ncbi:vacuole membrane protein 1 [Galendromus occidentalis]|uniref:Vacuole membrane protein 1 n=1 Tax=Galendromus occidentalis TaxID=34638 RepID=A0AAJ7L3F5_9ACAR|nr:vacuole membrane protein 1 [Galendromus occidentalis]
MSLLQGTTGRSRQNAANKSLNATNIETKSRGDHAEMATHSVIDLRTERQGIVLWKRPLTTTHYFVAELVGLLGDLIAKLWRNKGRVCVALVAFIMCVVAYRLEGGHQHYIKPMERTFLWCIYWVGLGVLSSIGLGTGLHTFLLYLGPHIAAVTLAASTCKSLNFPEPPYPDEIVCPEGETGDVAPGILAIMSKVRLEAFMWGAGTALGELPPYFMARAARISGEMDEEELENLEKIKALEKSDRTQLSLWERAEVAVGKLIEKIGFWGILASASIPNPLFDVAGFMCGHFLVPFRTFFGATLIGKAVIKMHIQKLFVIFVFDEATVEILLNLIKGVPGIGPRIEAPFEEFLQKQKDKFHRRSESSGDGDSMVSQAFEKFVLLMVLYFLVSIVNSMAQNYHKRINRKHSANHAKKY